MSWYKNWFADELYMELYAHRDGSEAKQAADLFERVTGQSGTSSGAGIAPNITASNEAASGEAASGEAADGIRSCRLLDLACGSGRHTFELARRGHRIAAADLSPTLLAAARRKTRRYGERVMLVRSDMRRLPFRACSFDAVLQLFTAFGYFRSDEENAAVIGEVRGVLRPGGWYMLDFLNSTQLRAALVPHSEQHVGGVRVVQERTIAGNRVEKRIHIHRDGGEREFRESVRLFTLDDFRRMFQQHRLSLAHVFGDYAGGAYDASSPRCLMFARAVE